MTEQLSKAPITRFTGDYGFLSNFFVSPFPYGRIAWPTVEHAFQAHKTLDPAARAAIASLPTAREAKKAGRALDLRPDWEQIRKQVMLDLLIAKFRHYPKLARRLAETGGQPLVEGNAWHDQYWGSCNCGQPACQQPGLNYLGQLLMAVRLTYTLDAAW